MPPRFDELLSIFITSCFHVLTLTHTPRYPSCSAFLVSLCCGISCRSCTDTALCVMFARETYWCSAKRRRRLLRIMWRAHSTNGSSKDFSTYTYPQLIVFVYNTCANSTVDVDLCWRLRTSASSLAMPSSLT